MVDDRLGRHSVLVASLGLISGAVVVIVLAVGSPPPLCRTAMYCCWWSSRSRRWRRSSLRGSTGATWSERLCFVGALLMVGVWYALLILPAAAVCSVARGNACM